MENIIKGVLIDSIVDSIEYIGFYLIKVSLSEKSIISDLNGNLIIDFVNGCLLRDSDNKNKIFFDPVHIYGSMIIDIRLDLNDLIFKLSNGFELYSVNIQNGLYDLNWEIRTKDNVKLFYNDTYETYMLEEMKRYLK